MRPETDVRAPPVKTSADAESVSFVNWVIFMAVGRLELDGPFQKNCANMRPLGKYYLDESNILSKTKHQNSSIV